METIKTNFDIARGIVRRYMANYTATRTAPKSVKSGFYAMIASDTGEVWLAEAGSFTSTLNRFHSRNNKQLADCMTKAIARGASLEIWLLTRPDVYSAQQLENELFEADVLANRKAPVRQGEGEMLVIRHGPSSDYFVKAQRTSIDHHVSLSQFLYALQRIGTTGYNQRLSDFITKYSDDILKGINFTVTPVDKFKDNDDLWLKRNLYIEGNVFGQCLNHRNVEAN